MTQRPVIGITMGDPAGIGPEIIVKALTGGDLHRCCRPMVIGDPGVLAAAISALSGDLSLRIVPGPEAVRNDPGVIHVMALSRLEQEWFRPGTPTVEGGKAMVRYIIRAVEMCMAGSIAAMVTCPVSKVLMHRAGYRYDGHTPLLAHLTKTKDHVMMLMGERLRVVLVTIHRAIREVPGLLTREGVFRVISVTSAALRQDFGLEDPSLAVAALNPHAGEEGLFGTEEETIIAPAVRQALEAGYRVAGPLPADTLFFKAASGRFDAVVCMYHDQGLIPLKLLHFSDGVNVTLGLPIIRTSVDHGTAYDIAGTGKADAASLRAAVRTAAEMAENRRRFGNERRTDKG